jgi:hypothetical protein
MGCGDVARPRAPGRGARMCHLGPVAHRMTRGRTPRGDLYMISPAFDNVLVARSLLRRPTRRRPANCRWYGEPDRVLGRRVYEMRRDWPRSAGIALIALWLASCTNGGHEGESTVRQPSAASQLETATALPTRVDPSGDTIPESLHRDLHLPPLERGGNCPTSSGRSYSNSLFGGIRLGSGPVVPLIGVAEAAEVAPAKKGILHFHLYRDHPGWMFVKTLWFSFPSYTGPVLVRGRQLDGIHPVGMGDAPSTADQEWSGPTVNGGEGFREWPGGTWLRAPGCYAWQVDGLSFSNVIVFEAEFVR